MCRWRKWSKKKKVFFYCIGQGKANVTPNTIQQVLHSDLQYYMLNTGRNLTRTPKSDTDLVFNT